MTNQRVNHQDFADLSTEDKALLDLLQSDFPLVSEPFSVLAQMVGGSQQQLLRHVDRFKEKGFVRYIRGTFDSRRLGYDSALVAMSVEPTQLDAVADHIGEHPGVTHNYARNHDYNLWFTVTVPPDQSLQRTVDSFAGISGVDSVHILRALRVFKIDVRFSMLSERTRRDPGKAGNYVPAKPEHLSGLEIAAVRQFQTELPLVERPFDHMARALDIGVAQFLEIAQGFLARRIMRRYGAVVNHRRAGYVANAMGCWSVPPPMVENVGRTMASYPAVTHCYERPTFADWPYNMFTMIHGHTPEECQDVSGEIARETGIGDYILLYSTREYKKESIKYFI